MKLDSLYIF